MSKLHIQRFEDRGIEGYVVRFVGHTPEFMRMVEDLKSHYPDAHFDRDLFDGKGGWYVEKDILLDYSDRFDNIWRCIHEDEERQRAELRRRINASVERVERKLGIDRDINEVPF